MLNPPFARLARQSVIIHLQRAQQSGSLKTLCRLFPEIWLNQETQVAHVNHDDTYLDENLAVVASNSPVARRIRVQESTRA